MSCSKQEKQLTSSPPPRMSRTRSSPANLQLDSLYAIQEDAGDVRVTGDVAGADLADTVISFAGAEHASSPDAPDRSCGAALRQMW